MVRLPESHLDLLERPVFAHLATVRPDCTPLVNPMWFLWDRDEGFIKLTWWGGDRAGVSEESILGAKGLNTWGSH